MLSAHFYQLTAYLRNQSVVPGWRSVAGVLLYPAVDHRRDENLSLNGHALRVVSIDPDRPWSAMRADLMEACDAGAVDCATN